MNAVSFGVFSSDINMYGSLWAVDCGGIPALPSDQSRVFLFCGQGPQLEAPAGRGYHRSYAVRRFVKNTMYSFFFQSATENSVKRYLKYLALTEIFVVEL